MADPDMTQTCDCGHPAPTNPIGHDLACAVWRSHTGLSKPVTTDQPRADAAHVRAPWTNEQVDALNRFQREGRMHPFTCGGEHTGGAPVLIASHGGWHCPHAYCTYRQDWAHAFMADPDAWPAPFLRTDLGTEFVRQADNPDWDVIEQATAEASTLPKPGGSGIRGLLEHVGIDLTGRDITVNGKVVDAWADRDGNAPEKAADMPAAVEALHPGPVVRSPIGCPPGVHSIFDPCPGNCTEFAFTWAETVASHGTGDTAVVDIDIHAPGHDEPVPVEIPLAEARTLHAMLGDALAHHGVSAGREQCDAANDTAQHATDPGTGSLRDRIAGAIRAAAHWCDGECGKTERECDDAHPLQAWVWTFGVVSGVHGPPEAFADAVLAAVRPEMDALADDRDRLAAELNTQRPGDALWVRAYGEEIRAAQQSAENMQGRAAALAVQVDQLIARLGEYADRGIANGQRTENAEAALERIRALHRPVTWPAEPPIGAHSDAGHFDGPVTVCAAESDDPAGRTHWTPWPCATIRALDDPIPTDSTAKD